jgi:hypothetical protein
MTVGIQLQNSGTIRTEGAKPMTLLDAPPPKPPLHIGRYILLGILMVLVTVGLYFVLRNYPEERAVARFLTTLEQGKFQEAYRLWQPSPSYSYQDFLHDWGIQGDYGKIREFQILGTKSQGSSLVIVTIKVNNIDPPFDLVVDRKTKGLSYSIF